MNDAIHGISSGKMNWVKQLPTVCFILGKRGHIFYVSAPAVFPYLFTQRLFLTEGSTRMETLKSSYIYIYIYTYTHIHTHPILARRPKKKTPKKHSFQYSYCFMVRHPNHFASRQPYQAMLNYYSTITYIPDPQFNPVPLDSVHIPEQLCPL